MRLCTLAFLLCLATGATQMVTAQTCPSPLAEGDWTAVDEYALAANAHDERDLKRLARYLQRAGRSDGARIRAVYRWVADRISYNAEAAAERRPTPQLAPAVLESRIAVCEGYSRLMVALLANMGVEAHFVSGWALPPSGSAAISPDGLHAWVAAKSESGWVLSDPTWGAGYVSDLTFHRAFDPSWFATPPDVFAVTHIPEAEPFQLLASPLSLNDAVARVTPEASCLAEPGGEPRIHHWSREVSSSGRGPEWKRVGGVRFRYASHLPEFGFRKGSKVTFRIEVEDAHSVAVFDGAIHTTTLRASGDMWSGNVRVGASPVQIGVKQTQFDQWRMVMMIPVID